MSFQGVSRSRAPLAVRGVPRTTDRRSRAPATGSRRRGPPSCAAGRARGRAARWVRAGSPSWHGARANGAARALTTACRPRGGRASGRCGTSRRAPTRNRPRSGRSARTPRKCAAKRTIDSGRCTPSAADSAARGRACPLQTCSVRSAKTLRGEQCMCGYGRAWRDCRRRT